jgi:hypothetical protein
MTERTLKVTSAEIATIRLALQGWAVRCDREERTMRELAQNYEHDPETRARCFANADASSRFASEARQTLARMP